MSQAAPSVAKLTAILTSDGGSKAPAAWRCSPRSFAPPPWLVLEIVVGKLLPVSVAYDEASVVEFPFDAQRSLCDAPIDMRLCGLGLRKPSDRPVLIAAPRCLKLYVFELMANASFI